MHIQHPTPNTIKNFYDNFNYNKIFKEQMQHNLDIQSHYYKKVLNADATVSTMQSLIAARLPTHWEPMKKHTKVVLNFNNSVVAEPIKPKLTSAWTSRTDWINRVAPSILTDFCTPVYGEDWDEMEETNTSDVDNALVLYNSVSDQESDLED